MGILILYCVEFMIACLVFWYKNFSVGGWLASELIKYSSGHTDTNMTNQYTNPDKVELSRSFPDIVAMKDGGLEDKKGLRMMKLTSTMSALGKVYCLWTFTV